MTVGPAPPCPKCKRALDSYSWRDAAAGHAGVDRRRSLNSFQFPALTASRTTISAQAAELAAGFGLFFSCGKPGRGDLRRLWPVVVPGMHGDFTGWVEACPACISATKTSDAATVVRDRVLFESIALGLAVLPLLVWIFTVITAPVALGFVIYGWRKPGSLRARPQPGTSHHRRRVRRGGDRGMDRDRDLTRASSLSNAMPKHPNYTPGSRAMPPRGQLQQSLARRRSYHDRHIHGLTPRTTPACSCGMCRPFSWSRPTGGCGGAWGGVRSPW